MDASGWPDIPECLELLRRVAPDGLNDAVAGDIPNLLPSVISHFQSPVGRQNTGGTGREFTPKADTRYYDGNGFPELVIEEIVPTETLTVSFYDTVLTDISVKRALHGLGFNVLYRPQSAGSIMAASFGLSGFFPLGKQNIKVVATFGYAKPVPRDIWAAVRGEVVYQAVVNGAVGIEGVGQRIKVGSYEEDTNSPVGTFISTSPLPTLHNRYTDCIKAYRDTQTWKWKRITPRMS